MLKDHYASDCHPREDAAEVAELTRGRLTTRTSLHGYPPRRYAQAEPELYQASLKSSMTTRSRSWSLKTANVHPVIWSRTSRLISPCYPRNQIERLSRVYPEEIESYPAYWIG